MKRFLTLLSVVALVAVSVPFLPSAAGTEVSIMFTHDMHSHFDAERVISNGAEMERGGFARLKTAINSVMAEHPGSFLLDGGDFAMGTPYQTIFSMQAPELRMMGRMGFDATTLGNHEFDYRARGLIDMLGAGLESGDQMPPVIASNIDWERTLADPVRAADAAELKALLERAGNLDYTMIERGGVKAAVFGLMGKVADSYAPESGMYFKDPIEASKEIVSRIKADGLADIIICLSHSGTDPNPDESEDELLAKAVPEIDVIISGHTHTKLDEPIVIGNTLVVSAGEYTYYLGHLTLKRDGDRYAVSTYRLIPINEALAKDPAVEADVLRFREHVNSLYLSSFGYAFEQVLATNDIAFTPIDQFGKTQGEDTLGNLISDSYIAAVQQAEGDQYRPVDVVIVPQGVVRGSFALGEITVADAFNVSSLGIGPDRVPGYPLVSVYLTGSELKTMAEIDISVSTLMSEARLYMSGLSYTYNPNRLLLNRVTGVMLTGADGSLEKPEDQKLYRVIGGLYSCQMMSVVEAQSYGLLKVVPKDADGNPITDFEQHIVYDGGSELKEWVALARYLESFRDASGVSAIPAYYGQTHGRKVEIDSRSPVELFKSPNKIFFILSGAILLILILLALPIFFIVRIVRKRRG